MLPLPPIKFTMKQDMFQLGLLLMFSVMTIVAHPHHRPHGRGAGRPTEPIAGRALIDRRLHLEEGSVGVVGGVGMSEKLRRDVLANYDRRSYPFEYAWNISMAESGIRGGIAVEIDINFHRLFDVDEARSSVDLVVWFRQRWTDPRLSWDPLEYGGLDTLWLWIEGGHGNNEVSEIWTPDLHLWNAEIPVSESLADTSAVVSSDGTVYWSRPGRLRSICDLQGLQTFPFGEVQCTMEIGSWTMSGLYVRPKKLDDGYSIGGSQTSAHSFPEYTLKSVVCEEHTYPPYPIDPEEDWPVLFYHVTFSRASKTYIRGFVFLQIVLNFAGFCCFWISPTCGERISLAITALLAAVASELVVAQKLPVCNELTWFAKFALVSLCFAALALFESTVVVFFFYFTGTDLWPKYVTLVWKKCRAGKGQKPAEHGKEGPRTDVQDGAPDEPPDGTSRQVSWSSEKALGEKALRVLGADLQQDGTVAPTPTLLRRDSCPEELKRPSLGNSRILRSIRNLRSLEHDKEKKEFRRDFNDFKNFSEAERNVRWQAVAANIDSFSRLVIPAAYVLYLSVAFLTV